MTRTAPDPARPPNRLAEVAWLFLRLGATAFGGPAAHIALLDREVVQQRRWLSREEFLDLLGATQLIPGPNSTEMAIHIGLRRAGPWGLVVAGLAFILPAATLVTVIAWAYQKYGQLPQAAGLLYGIKPVLVAIIAQALWGLGRTALKSKFLVAISLLAAALTLSGVNELGILGAAGVIAALALNPRRTARPAAAWAIPALEGSAPILPTAPATPSLPLVAATGALAGTATAATVATPFGLWPLFLFFLKVGSVLFGSGYVLLAFLDADLVARWHWLTKNQLLDAIAVGQFTPGPVFTTATFIGYLLGGVEGAFVATAGIFLPAFLFVAISGPLIPRLRRSPTAGAFLDGVNVASLALMAVITARLARVAILDLPTLALLALTAFLLARTRLNSAWLVLGGGLIGLALVRTAGG